MAIPARIINELISRVIPSYAIDVVGVYTQDFNQAFSRARPLKAIVKETSKLMEHPVETGATVTDHRIILPIEIELSLILQAEDYRNVYQEIKQLYLNAELLTVQTKSDNYENQVISEMPHEEDPQIYDALVLALKLKEVQFITAQFTTLQPRNPSNSSTVNRGTQQPSNASPQNTEKTSFLYRRFAQ